MIIPKAKISRSLRGISKGVCRSCRSSAPVLCRERRIDSFCVIREGSPKPTYGDAVSDHRHMSAAEPLEGPILAALVRRDPAAVARLAGADRAVWDQVCARARGHRCLPYLCWVLDQAGAVPSVPFDAAIRRRWGLRALSVQGECLRLTRILSEAGIAHLFLKGVPLAAAAYPEPWLRPLRDIDILVHPADLAAAQALLLDHGGPIDRYAHKTGSHADPTAKHLPPVWSPGRIIAVELHGHAADAGAGLDAEGQARLDAMLWDGAVEMPLAGGVLPVPGPEALFVHLVLHGVYDHELNNGPLFLTDLIHLMARMPPDPARVAALAQDLRVARGLALALSLLPDETTGRAGIVAALRAKGVDLPELPEDSAAALLLQDSAMRSELRLAADLAAGPKTSRLRLLASKVFPSRETMTDRWRMEGHEGPEPVSNMGFWLWFITIRLRGMRRAGTRAPQMRDHLIRLRGLRDGHEE